LKSLEELGLIDVLKVYEEKKSGAFILRESHLKELGKYQITGNPEIKKKNNYRIKDEEVMCGQALESEQSHKINEHSILANPGIYIFVEMYWASLSSPKIYFIEKIIINEPYKKNIEILYPLSQKEPWGIIKRHLFRSYNLPFKNVATKEEAKEAQPNAWDRSPYINDEIECKFISLTGHEENEAAAFLIELREYIDKSKNYKTTTLDKIKLIKNLNHLARAYFVTEPAFETSDDIDDIAKNMFKESDLTYMLRSYKEKKGDTFKLHEAVEYRKYPYDYVIKDSLGRVVYDHAKWKNFRDRSEDHLTKDHLNKGINRKALGGYFTHEAEEIAEKIRSGELNVDEMEADDLVMSAMKRANRIDKNGKIDSKKKGFFKKMFEADFASTLRESGSFGSSAYEQGKEIVVAIKEFGNFCYFVGGAVRDHILGAEPNDVDLVTDMSEKFLQEKMGGLVKNKFWRNGSQVLVLEKDGEEFEVKRLSRSMKLEQELSQRDVTFNSIAWDPTTDEYVDPTGGRRDLEKGVVEFTPFTLDAVAEGKQPARVIRFFRFVSTTGFEAGEKSKESLKKYAQLTGGRFGVGSEETLRNNWSKFEKGKNKKAAMNLMCDRQDLI
jgi:hypothetical protein